MDTQIIKKFLDYLKLIENLKVDTAELLLFRGQSSNDPLLPSIARKEPKKDTTELERQMLKELIRQTNTKINGQQFDEWDWLIYAQHYGMKTRLLDWTSNPLTALWFACSNPYKMNSDSYVYIFLHAEEFLLDKSKEKSPFTRSKTKVLKPTLNNQRVISQSGWFTAHKYSKTNERFVDLRSNREMKENIMEVQIPNEIKTKILEGLNLFGINNKSLFNDIGGICQHINWEFTAR
ncbi:FRG domain-containing protein [Marivirga sp. S37H4]|uniref:FRG domain-containing protein n=1 Tax=Marivirga aurantiaca TaxID=2802615 RepID=A0A934X284_9BACT|nr:FRG domain-containing protein [Marivirga aurantiaca]MBK6266956.1 FRG domain-containing protein [Marivirga aurantiaca]